MSSTSLPTPIRVAIYEDSTELRQTLSLLVELTDDFVLVGAHGHADFAKTEVQLERPDVVIMDIDMPGIGGISAIPEVAKGWPAAKVLMFTVFDDSERLFESLKAGASGYLLKKTPHDRITTSIREAAEGGAPISSGMARRMVDYFQKPAQMASNYALTERERQVLEGLVRGYSYKMIADEIMLSIDTVRTHIKKVYDKLHVHSGPEAVAKAIRERIV